MIATAVIAAVLINYDIDELTITGPIKAGLPAFKLPAFSFNHVKNNGTETIHKDFGEILSVSVFLYFFVI